MGLRRAFKLSLALLVASDTVRFERKKRWTFSQQQRLPRLSFCKRGNGYSSYLVF